MGIFLSLAMGGDGKERGVEPRPRRGPRVPPSAGRRRSVCIWICRFVIGKSCYHIRPEFLRKFFVWLCRGMYVLNTFFVRFFAYACAPGTGNFLQNAVTSSRTS